MVFGNMGAPLEHFQGNNDKSNNEFTMNYYNCNDEYTIMQGDNKFCMVKTDVELSEDPDMFGEFDNASTNWTDDNFDCVYLAASAPCLEPADIDYVHEELHYLTAVLEAKVPVRREDVLPEAETGRDGTSCTTGSRSSVRSPPRHAHHWSGCADS